MSRPMESRPSLVFRPAITRVLRIMQRHPASALLFALTLPLAIPAPSAAQTFDRTKPPTLAPPARLVVPTVRASTLPNGASVKVVEQRELPLVQVTAIFGGGSRLDGDRPGIASFVAGMLDEGAGTRDAAALQSELAFLGATLRTAADWDRIIVSLKVPARSLGPALDLMADVIRRPSFAAAEVRQQRELRLANLSQLRDEPTDLAELALNQVVFPAGHPYHANPDGDSVSTAALDSATVRAFYSRALRPERATFIVVGDITEAAARTQLARRFGNWRANDGTAATETAITVQPRRETSSHVYLVDKPDAAQSVVSIGWPGVDRRTPDYAALMVMNTLLGGSFTSRLNMNLRERKGYSYGARSGFSFSRAPGPFTAGASVRTDVTDSSLVEFFRELRTVRDSIVPPDELARAKSYVELGLPEALESTTQVAGQISNLGIYGLSLSDLTTFAMQVRAVTAADVQRVARQYLTPDNATIVVVGDLSKIRAPIEALKLGDLTVIDVKDVVR